MALQERIKRAWSVFMNKDPTYQMVNTGSFGSSRSGRRRLSVGNTKSIINPLYNRIAIDCSEVNIFHVRTDSDGRFKERIKSELDYCLNVEANIDQTGRAFRQDVVLTMLDRGVVAIVPYRTDVNPNYTSSYKIEELRVGVITEWYPKSVKVDLYDDDTGRHREVIVDKRIAAIIENPFYSVMNEPNSVAQRLIRKLNLLDAVDEQSGSGKLDLIIQLPYVVKSESRRAQAEKRRQDIENQLAGSKYGIAYTDGTEHITQLNRSVENNLLKTIEYLTSMLYSQLGMTQSIMDGSADEQTLLNYNARIVEPIIASVVDEMKRTFLTKTAMSQGQSIMFFNDPFRLVPVGQIAEIADKMTRNEIMTSNEIRQEIGLKPSDDPAADELRNKNLSRPSEDNHDENDVNNDEVVEK